MLITNSSSLLRLQLRCNSGFVICICATDSVGADSALVLVREKASSNSSSHRTNPLQHLLRTLPTRTASSSLSLSRPKPHRSPLRVLSSRGFSSSPGTNTKPCVCSTSAPKFETRMFPTKHEKAASRYSLHPLAAELVGETKRDG